MRKNLVALLWGAGGTAIVLVLYMLWGVMYEDHARTTVMWEAIGPQVMAARRAQPQQQPQPTAQPEPTPEKK